MTQNSSEKIHLVKGSHHHPKIIDKPEEQVESQNRPATSVQHIQPKDASSSGNKSLEQNKVLEKNIQEGQTRRHSDTPAGQHATGSFTGAGQDKKS